MVNVPTPQTQCMRLLCVSHPVVLDSGAVVSQGDLGGGGTELRQAEDGQVLVVQAVVLHDQPLHLLHHREHPGQAVVSTVGCREHKTTQHFISTLFSSHCTKTCLVFVAVLLY